MSKGSRKRPFIIRSCMRSPLGRTAVMGSPGVFSVKCGISYFINYLDIH